VVSRPSPDHPSDEDLSLGTPAKRWTGHGAFFVRMEFVQGLTFQNKSCCSEFVTFLNLNDFLAYKPFVFSVDFWEKQKSHKLSE
jgi:hypothetical protein